MKDDPRQEELEQILPTSKLEEKCERKQEEEEDSKIKERKIFLLWPFLPDPNMGHARDKWLESLSQLM